ncbi:MAG TPA: bifunctional adenosylcobinamide kinase/adenosylcobinamide-phosphate guanylyltransferase [Desulfatiglandales bacterium]
MPDITLITGGARSGKSSFALSLGLRNYSKRVFIATAVPFDQEMKERISRHREDRGDQFHTIEEPIDLPRVLTILPSGNEVVVVDCLTVWLGNLYHHFQGEEEKVRVQVEAFLAHLDHPACDLILVTNEVGWGIVPENPLARSFRDMAGYLNRHVAQKAAYTYLLCCGIPLTLKGEPLRG